MSVNKDGSVTVKAPLRYPTDREIADFVEQKIDWVLKQREIQEDREARAGLTHKDTIDRYDYQGKVLKITRTENKTIVEYDGQKKTEDKYLTPTEAVELITNG
jgi:predicted metal-dependent hydrolase